MVWKRRQRQTRASNLGQRPLKIHSLPYDLQSNVSRILIDLRQAQAKRKLPLLNRRRPDLVYIIDSIGPSPRRNPTPYISREIMTMGRTQPNDSLQRARLFHSLNCSGFGNILICCVVTFSANFAGDCTSLAYTIEYHHRDDRRYLMRHRRAMWLRKKCARQGGWESSGICASNPDIRNGC